MFHNLYVLKVYCWDNTAKSIIPFVLFEFNNIKNKKT